MLASEPRNIDVALARRAINARCARDLNAHDRDDIAARVIADSWRTAKSLAALFGAVVKRTSSRPRYYTDARRDALRHRTFDEPTTTNRAARPMVVAPGSTGELVDRPGVIRIVANDDAAILEVEMRDLVARLPTNVARAFWLVHWHGHTLQESAAILGVSFKTVHRWQQEARELLAESYAAALAA